MTVERCTWCGRPVEPGDGLRAFEPAGARRAVFCRLEHVVPWAIRGAVWEVDERSAPAAEATAPEHITPEGTTSAAACVWCDAPLGEARVVLVRSRGEHRIADGFCGVEHLLAWAKAGGRYARARSR